MNNLERAEDESMGGRNARLRAVGCLLVATFAACGDPSGVSGSFTETESVVGRPGDEPNYNGLIDPSESPLAGGTEAALSDVVEAFPVPVFRPDHPLASDATVDRVFYRLGGGPQVYATYDSGITVTVRPVGREARPTEDFGAGVVEDGYGAFVVVEGVNMFEEPAGDVGRGYIRFDLDEAVVVIMGNGELPPETLRELAGTVLATSGEVSLEHDRVSSGTRQSLVDPLDWNVLSGGEEAGLQEIVDAFPVAVYRPDHPLASDETLAGASYRLGRYPEIYAVYQSGVILKVGELGKPVVSTERFAEWMISGGSSGTLTDVGGIPMFEVQRSGATSGSLTFVKDDTVVTIIGHGDFPPEVLREVALTVSATPP